MESGQSGLGIIVHQHGNECICEQGIHNRDRSIRWDDIKDLRVSGQKTTSSLLGVPLGTSSENMKIEIIDYQNIKISISNWNILGAIGTEKKEQFNDIYAYVISKIIDRQWKLLTTELSEGREVSFKDFIFTPDGVRFKKLFGGYDTIKLERIYGCYIGGGESYALFVDEKNKIEQRFLGYTKDTPNIHLVRMYLNHIGKRNGWVVSDIKK